MSPVIDLSRKGVTQYTIKALLENELNRLSSDGVNHRAYDLDLSHNTGIDTQVIKVLGELLTGKEIATVIMNGCPFSIDNIKYLIWEFYELCLVDMSESVLEADDVDKIINCMIDSMHRSFQLYVDWNSPYRSELDYFGNERQWNKVYLSGRQRSNRPSKAFAPPSYRFVDSISHQFVDSFLLNQSGVTWDMLNTMEIPIESLADEVIAQIPKWMLEEALLNAGALLGPQLVLKKFGSSVNGFGSNKSSDIDLVIVPETDWEWYWSKFGWAQSQKEFAQDYLYWLQQQFPASWDTECIRHARVPLLRIRKFPVSRSVFVDVDITCMNNVCLHNSDLLRKYAEQSPDIFGMCHLVKVWAKSNELVSSQKNSHSFPSSYAWICMVIYFLQERIKAVPSLIIPNTRSDSEAIWGCRNGEFTNVKTEKKLHQKSETSRAIIHFSQFMRFLIEDSNRVLIDFVNPSSRSLSGRAELQVLDPLELGRNLTANMTASSFNRIQKCAQSSFDRIGRIRTFKDFTDIILATSSSPSLMD